MMRRALRWLSAGTITCAMLLLGGAEGAVAADRYVFMGGDYADVWRSYNDGQWTKKLTDCATDYCNYANPALSPTGQTIALDTGWSSIALMDINGRHERTLVDDQLHDAYNPEFTPDGLRVIYTAQSDDLTGTDVFSMRTAGDSQSGSDRDVVLGGPGDQEDADFSADGARIAFSNQPSPDGRYELFVANADGTEREPLDTSSQIEGGVWEPKWSPDGSRIAFYARTVPRTWPRQPDDDLEIWIINADGTGLHRITNDDKDQYAPEWSPDGGLLIYDQSFTDAQDDYAVYTMTPDGADAHRLPHSDPAVDSYSAEATWRRPSSMVDGKDFQAAEFRPELLFDADEPGEGSPGERWRPLNAEKFLAEGH